MELIVILLVSLSFSDAALQKSHEKSQLEKWQDTFFDNDIGFDQTGSLVRLLKHIARDHLIGCTAVVLYDNYTENNDDLLLARFFNHFPVPYVHGRISDDNVVHTPKLLSTRHSCMAYILFMKDVMKSSLVIGDQTYNKVIVVARSSQWRVYEFLASDHSQSLVNLLVIAKSEKIASTKNELPYILYTHKLFVDGLGSSVHQVLTSWYKNKFTKPNNTLFPRKIEHGFAGHRFLISVAHRPPFVIKRGTDDNDDVQWDGIEYRLIELLSKMFNFTTDFKEAKNSDELGPTDSVVAVVNNKKANLGIAGLYVTEDNLVKGVMSFSHSQDCAAFITLTSTALPRYRAIMGPFHWSVWVSLIFVYLFAVFPLAFSDKHTFKHLIKKPQEIENMFWYMFGTFTNSFTFMGNNSWSQSDKVTTRLLIGFYWLFTIIITACYTGSIIAFVTLPVYPATIDTIDQLLHGRYQIGSLDKGGWENMFKNITDPLAMRLLNRIDYVPDIESGLKNTTKAFFWPYAFMGSQRQLDYIVRTNFSTENKRSLLHISDDCFIPFKVAIIYRKNSVYADILDMGLLHAIQSGLMDKLKSDVEWHMMRSATGKLLAANSFNKKLMLSYEDRALTLDDTQGMFLLLGIGFLVGGASLFSEIVGGCCRFCRKTSDDGSIASVERSYVSPTPRQKLDSMRSSIDMDSRQVVECVVHCDKDGIDKEIDRMFDMEGLFGDINGIDPEKNEELI